MFISEDIKARLHEIPILSVADALGIQVIRRRSARCFMHDDHNPSLGFNISKNTWKCYVCDKGGDQITLVMKKRELSYVDACKWLADRFNIFIPNANGYRNCSKKKTINQTKTKGKEAISLIDRDIATWIISHTGLSEKAKEFLFKRRKYSESVVNSLCIGSISDSARLVNVLVNVFGKERTLASGIVRQNSRGLYLFFYTPCLMFPYTDIDGNIINIQTRYLGTNTKAPRFQFLPNVETGIFNAQLLKSVTRDDMLFVSEGVTDCLALLSNGKNAIAIPSATLLHKKDVKLIATKNLYMYPDQDVAGERLYQALSERLNDYGSMIMRVQLPDGCKDYSDYYLKQIEK